MKTSRETQTSFEDHPDAGSMMQAAMAVQMIVGISDEIRKSYADLKREVDKARANGVSWQKIGDALGVTRSAAQQYYGH
jgi:hypothetical protein